MEFAGINWALILPILILNLVLLITALVDLIRHWNVRKNAIIWLVVICFINTIGPVIYFIFGRKEEFK
ncbi:MULTISPECIES: PLD nuclease N-terminal domain-containing protein [Listeria]|uniref:PLD nuclease N-terminal domain-containing protein n=1 Tax=Listeria TaxID=1637 RepID=UPI000B5936FB|nr:MULTISPECIES: PLD nuclease N-terminal domain-containing protein [Listeria]